MGEVESQVISRVGLTVLARLIESQKWLQPAGSLTVGGRAQKGTMTSAHLCVERKLSPSYHLDARYFSPSLYATGAFQAAPPVVELRESES